jgi:tetratricopeptide (TPR) repeat protein
MTAQDPAVTALVQRLAKTRELAARSVREHPNDLRAVYGAAMAYRLSGDYASALEQFRHACKLAPENPDLLFECGAMQEAEGLFDYAKSSYSKALRLAPQHFRARLALVQLEKQTPDSNHIQLMEQQFQGPDADGWRTLHLGHALAKTYEDLRNYRASFAWLTKAKENRRRLQPYSAAEHEAVAHAAIASYEATANAAAGHPSAEPIFVCGMPRSGTTLVDRILSSHPDVSSAGEIGNFAQILKLLSKSRTPGTLDADTFRNSGNANFESLGKLYIDSTRPLTGHAKHFVDKAPSNYLLAGILARALPNAKLICLKRHPLDTAIGNYKQIFPIPDRYYDYVYALESVAHKYIQFDRVAAHWKRTLPADRYLELSYEDLVARQEEVTRALIAFCGLPWDARCLNFQENAAGVATPSAAQVRQAMNSSAVGRWTRYAEFLTPARTALEQAGIRTD